MNSTCVPLFNESGDIIDELMNNINEQLRSTPPHTNMNFSKDDTLSEFISDLEKDRKSASIDYKDILLNNLYAQVEHLRNDNTNKTEIIKEFVAKYGSINSELSKKSVSDNEEINELLNTIKNQCDQINSLKNDLSEKNEIIKSLSDTQTVADTEFFVPDHTLATDDLSFGELYRQYEDFLNAKEKLTKETTDNSDSTVEKRNLETKNSMSSDKKAWPKNTILVISDSIMNNIEENRLSRSRNVKVRPFIVSTIEDMFSYITPLLKKRPTYILLHVGTNNSTEQTSTEIFNQLLELKKYILKTLPQVQLIFSKPTLRLDNSKANFTLLNLSKLLDKSGLKLMDNSNIVSDHIGKKGLHLNTRGTARLAMNIISLIKTL